MTQNSNDAATAPAKRTWLRHIAPIALIANMAFTVVLLIGVRQGWAVGGDVKVNTVRVDKSIEVRDSYGFTTVARWGVRVFSFRDGQNTELMAGGLSVEDKEGGTHVDARAVHGQRGDYGFNLSRSGVRAQARYGRVELYPRGLRLSVAEKGVHGKSTGSASVSIFGARGDWNVPEGLKRDIALKGSWSVQP